MRRHAILFSVSCVCVLLLFTLSTLPVAGIPAYQLDPTDQQATVDAIVEQRFTQTAIAITEAPQIPTTVSTIAPTPIPTLTLMPTLMANPSTFSNTRNLSTVFMANISYDLYEDYIDGWEEYWRDDVDDAIDDFTDVIEVDPTWAHVYLARALVYISSGDYQEGLDDLATFEQLTGTVDGEVLFWRLIANYEEGNSDAVIQDGLLLEASPPFDSLVFAYLMETYLDTGAYQEALAASNNMQSIAYSYNNSNLYVLREEAFEAIDDDINAEFNNLMYEALEQRYDDDLRDAVDLFEEAIELAESENLSSFDLALAYLSLAVVELLQNDFDDALEHTESALAVEPNFAPIHHMRGIIYSFQGEDDDALEALTTAIAIDPLYAPSYTELAFYYSYDRDDEQAAPYLLQSILLHQYHAIQWNIDNLIDETFILSLPIGWTNRFPLELQAGDELTVTVSDSDESNATFDPVVVILDPSGNPIISSSRIDSPNIDAEINNLEIEEDGMYTIIIANNEFQGSRAAEVEIDID